MSAFGGKADISPQWGSEANLSTDLEVSGEKSRRSDLSVCKYRKKRKPPIIPNNIAPRTVFAPWLAIRGWPLGRPSIQKAALL